MATDFAISLENRPGMVAELGEVLGKAGINLDGVCGFAMNGDGLIHILVDDASTTREVLADSGYEIRGEREVIVTEVEDRPGELGAVTRHIADAGVNLDLLYLATGTRLVLGAADIDALRRAL